MENFQLSKELFESIAKLRPGHRRKVLRAIGKIEWEHCADDVIYWLDQSRHPWPYVYTLDNHPMYTCKLCDDGEGRGFSKCKLHLKVRHKIEPEREREVRGYFVELSTTRPFTLHGYMRPIIECWLAEPLFLVPKSRDMMATWLMVALHTWDMLFHTGRQVIFQSENSTKTLELVRRAWFIYKSQPKFLKEVHKAEFTMGGAKSGIVTIEELNSEILGFPQGADQIRQFHPSSIFLDEAAYQIQAGDSFTAIKPAIQSGGRFTAISSAAPGWFHLAATDQLEFGDTNA